MGPFFVAQLDQLGATRGPSSLPGICPEFPRPVADWSPLNPMPQKEPTRPVGVLLTVFKGEKPHLWVRVNQRMEL